MNHTHVTPKPLSDSLKTIIGPRLRRARETMQVSQGDLVEELARHGIDRTQGSMSQIENGKRLPSIEILYIATRYLETSADYLLGFTENELSAHDLEEEIATAKGGGRISRIMRLLSRDKKRQVVEFAEYLLGAAGRAESPDPNNEDAWHAALDVIERKHGKDVADDLMDALAANVPELALFVGPLPTKQKRINKS